MKLNKLIDKTFWLYVGLGLLNYGLCNVLMLVLHHAFDVDADTAIILEFALQTSISFLLNRYVTFRGIQISRWWPLKFVVSVAVSYVLAKVLLYKLFIWLITLPWVVAVSDWVQGIVARSADSSDFRESLVMLACTFTYCVFNYVGQRYYVFKAEK